MQMESSNLEKGRKNSDEDSVPSNSSMPKAGTSKKVGKRPRTKAEKQAAIKEKRARAMQFSTDSSTTEVFTYFWSLFLFSLQL